MYLLVDPHTGKRRATTYAQIEFKTSLDVSPLELPNIQPQEIEPTNDGRRASAHFQMKDEQTSTPTSVAVQSGTEEVSEMFAKLCNYCTMDEVSKEQPQRPSFLKLEEVIVQSTLISAEYAHLVKSTGDWILNHVSMIESLSSDSTLLNKFINDLQLMFTYCWNIDNFNFEKDVASEKLLINEVRKGLEFLFKGSSFSCSLQNHYDDLAARFSAEDICYNLYPVVDFLRSINNLRIIANKLDLRFIAKKLRLKLTLDITDPEAFLEQLTRIKLRLENQILFEPIFINGTNTEYYVCDLMCDMLDVFLQSETFYCCVFRNLRVDFVQPNEDDSKELIWKKIANLIKDARYATRKINIDVVKALHNKMLILCFTDSGKLHHEIEDVKMFFAYTLGVEESTLYFDKNCFGKYYFYLLGRISNNCSSFLAEHFREISSFMSHQTKRNFLEYLYDRITKALHGAMILTTESRLMSGTEHLALADIVGTSFGEIEKTLTIKALRKAHKELLQQPHVRSFVEIITVQNKGVEDLDILRSRKVKIPTIVNDNIKNILEDIKTSKEIKLNMSYNTVYMDFNMGSETCHLICSAFIAAVLVEFEDVDELSFQKLQKRTFMKDSLLKSCITSLQKVGLLLKGGRMIRINTNPSSLGRDLVIL